MLNWQRRTLVAMAMAIALFFVPIAPAHAFVPVDGIFVAHDSCEALQSIRRQTNPGDITLVPDMAYDVVGKNKSTATHYQVKVKGAMFDRWVPVGCGQIFTDCASAGADSGNGAGPGRTPSPGPDACSTEVSTDNLLAISWQPSFCEGHRNKTECKNQDASDFDAEHFTLHGLWPQPRGKQYCCLRSDFPRKPWSSQPDFDDDLDDETLALLADRRMPGFESFLHRHEWYKHGTCYNPTSEEPEQEYFEESLALLDQINTSSVQTLFADRIGERVKLSEIRDAFDQDFGPGAGRKVGLKCTRNGMVAELWVNLGGDIQVDTPIADLLAAAKDANSSCQEGLVDPVGFNL